MEAATGFEPVNDGFANRCLGPLGYAAPILIDTVIQNTGAVKVRPGAMAPGEGSRSGVGGPYAGP